MSTSLRISRSDALLFMTMGAVGSLVADALSKVVRASLRNTDKVKEEHEDYAFASIMLIALFMIATWAACRSASTSDTVEGGSSS